jgi:hypothetical protein
MPLSALPSSQPVYLTRSRTPMGHLSPAQVATLDEIWTNLWVGQQLASPPITDEELARDVLDSWLAGVLSSKGWLSEGALVDLLASLDELDDLGEVGSLVERVVQTVGRPD